MLNLQVDQCQEDEVKDQEMMNSMGVVVVAGNCKVELGIVVEGTFWFWNDFVCYVIIDLK